MGIKFRCHACDKKLHVKEFLAGKRGVCPRCGAKVRIPHESQDTRRVTAGAEAIQEHPPDGSRVATTESPKSPQSQGEPLTAAEATDRGKGRDSTGPQQQQENEADPIADAPDAVWYVRPPSGGEYGPANGAIMQRWLDEGRVSSDSMVWREGWPDWKLAGPLFSLFADTQQAMVDLPQDSAPTQYSDNPSSDNPSSDNPSSDNPSSDNPSSDDSSSDDPSSDNPSSDDSSSDDPFPIAAETKTGRRRIATTSRRTGRRHVTAITVMSALFVILLIVLAIVLRGQG